MDLAACEELKKLIKSKVYKVFKEVESAARFEGLDKRTDMAYIKNV